MYIHVTVIPNSKKESIEQLKTGYFNIRVKEKAERNMANKRVLDVLNIYFNNPKGGVRIVNGHQSPKKLIEIGE